MKVCDRMRNDTSESSLVVLICAVVILSTPQPSGGDLIVDGGAYVLDHQEGFCAVGGGATFMVVDGGYADEVSFSESTLVMNGGYLACARGSSGAATINGGEIHDFYFQGTFEVNGGRIVSASCEGTGYIRGGAITELYAVDQSGHAYITGGDIHYAFAMAGGQVDISGTGVENLWTQVGGRACVYGERFKLDGIDIGPRTLFSSGYDGWHVLEYSLADGSVGQTNIHMTLDSSVTLVPEPATLLLLALGGIALRARKRM